MRYLAKNNNGYYSFRIRVPENFRPHFNQTEIIKALKTKSYNEARKLCSLITADTLKLFAMLKLGVLDKEQEESIVNKYLRKILNKKVETTQTPINKPSSKTIEEPVKSKGKTLHEVVEVYLKNIPATTSEVQKKAYKAFFENIFFEFFDKKSFINDVDREKLLEVREIFQGLPKRNIQKYRSKKISQILKMNIKDGEKISIKTINDYLKWIMSLFSFAQKYGYIKFNPAVDLKFKLKGNAKEQREVFTDNELKTFVELNKDEKNLKLFHQTLFYTGMINSEFLQTKITKVDGVLCFDLTNPNLKLKTLARYRLIPIHSHLIDLGIVENLAYIQKNYTSSYLSKWSNKFIKKNISDSSKKVLYSFRHTFATKLQNEMLDEAVIAQLMGHSNAGMTFGRYAKGYVANTLKDAVEKLKFPNN